MPPPSGLCLVTRPPDCRGPGPAAEESARRAADLIGPYKLSKFQAEAGVGARIDDRGLPAVIVTRSTPIGPGDAKPPRTGRLIAEAARGRMPGFVATGVSLARV